MPFTCPLLKQWLHFSGSETCLHLQVGIGYSSYSKFLTYAKAPAMGSVLITSLKFLFPVLSFSCHVLKLTLNVLSGVWLVYFLINILSMSWLFHVSAQGHGFVIVALISKCRRLNFGRISFGDQSHRTIYCLIQDSFNWDAFMLLTQSANSFSW